MHLNLSIPPEWPIKHMAGQQVAIVPGSEKPDLLLLWGPLVLLPDEQKAWVQRTMLFEAPNARLDVTSDKTFKTDTGWPVRVVEATLLNPADNSVIEWRLGAFYAFFEHGATALVRATAKDRYEEFTSKYVPILRAATPNWGGEIAALSQLWDVSGTPDSRETSRRRPLVAKPFSVASAPAEAAESADTNSNEPVDAAQLLLQRATAAGSDEAGLTAVLVDIDAALEDDATPRLHLVRGRVLRVLGKADPALEAFEAAIKLDSTFAPAHRSAGLALAAAGREDDAIAAWKAAAAADPLDNDALFNLGQVHYNRGDFAAALEFWQQALERKPSDFWTLRKIVQSHYGLEQFDEAAEVRKKLVQVWRTSSDADVRLADEYVFDQFAVGDFIVCAIETLRPRDPASYEVLGFRVVFPEGKAAPLSVHIETSNYARERGTPFVLSILDGKNYRALGTSEQIPPYPELKKTVSQLVEQAIAGRAAAKPN